MADPLDDPLGDIGTPDALHIELAVTVFPDMVAKRKTEWRLTLPKLAAQIQATNGATKRELPWLKLATFGDQGREHTGCLRSNENMCSVTGIEGDYDGGGITMAEAVGRLRRFGIGGLFYSTPSSTPEHPRWRVLVPLSAPQRPEARHRFATWLHGVFDGALDEGATFTQSQGHHFGRVTGEEPVHVELVAGKPIDLIPSLQSFARGKRNATPSPDPLDGDGGDDDDWYVPNPDWDRIKEALAVIPSHSGREDSYDEWRAVGMALHDATRGSDDGLAVFTEWSRGWSEFKGREIPQKWRSFRHRDGKGITIATLFDIAKRYGWGKPPPTLASRYTFLTPTECGNAPQREYLWKSVVARGDVVCAFGDPGAGKSLLGPHLGYAVARGASAFGRRTRAGRVFYVAAEDQLGMRARTQALRMAHGDADDFLLLGGFSDLKPDSEDLAALKAAVEAQRPALVIIDTLAMAFPGIAENEAEGMGLVVKVARGITVHGAAVIIIHHGAKHEGSTPRGSGALNGALDVAIHVTRDEEGIVRGKLTKNRNGPCDVDIAFRIDVRTLGTDEDGDPITAALVKELAPGEAPPKKDKLRPHDQCLHVLRRMADSGDLGSTGDGWVPEDAWRAACAESRSITTAEKPESRQRMVRKYVRELSAGGLIEIHDGQVRAVRVDRKDAFDDVLD